MTVLEYFEKNHYNFSYRVMLETATAVKGTYEYQYKYKGEERTKIKELPLRIRCNAVLCKTEKEWKNNFSTSYKTFANREIVKFDFNPYLNEMYIFVAMDKKDWEKELKENFSLPNAAFEVVNRDF